MASESKVSSESVSKNVSSMVGLRPIVKTVKDTSDGLTFTVSNSNVSFVNALRRVILSEIPTVVFRTAPYEKSMTKIIANTSRLTNEILKQRISCIPIHLNATTDDIDSLVVEIDETNETDTVRYITTQDFKIKDTRSGKYLSKEKTKEIFPPNELTKDYIIINRLRPKISDAIPGEKMHVESKMVVTTASEDSCFNVASTCSYGFTEDKVKQKEQWRSKASELKKGGSTEDEIAYEEQNWYLNDAKRVYLQNSFDFIVQTIGVYTNQEIIHKACDVMVEKCAALLEKASLQQVKIEQNNAMQTGSFDITLENEDYTIGKCIECVMHEQYYKPKNGLSFVGFLKSHPYDTDSIIRVVGQDYTESSVAQFNTMLLNSIQVVKEYFEALKSQV